MSFGGNLKIREEPEAIGPTALRQAWDEAFENFPRKTIEEKMAGDEVKLAGWQVRLKDVRLDEFDAFFVEASAADGLAGAIDHSGALLDDGDAGRGVELEKRNQKATVPLAEEEGGAGVEGAVEKRGAAVLQLLSGAETFHPPIMAGQKVKAHAVAGRWDSPRCHHNPARRAPEA